MKVVSVDIGMNGDFAYHDYFVDGSSSTFHFDSRLVTTESVTFADSPDCDAQRSAALAFGVVLARRVSVDVHFECFASFLMSTNARMLLCRLAFLIRSLHQCHAERRCLWMQMNCEIIII